MDRDRLASIPSNPSKKPAVAGTLFAFAIICVAAASFAQQGIPMIAIDKMDIGSPPPGFEFGRTGQGGAAQWKVAEDASANGGRAIEQVSTDRTDYRFPLAIYSTAVLANGEVTLRFKAVAGQVDQAAGIAMRLSDADNYYVVRANALEDNVRFYRVVKGRREQLAGVNIKVSSAQWHSLGLKAEGERFSIAYNDKPLFTATDRTFAAAGKIALWTKSDSVVRFDSIEIKAAP